MRPSTSTPATFTRAGSSTRADPLISARLSAAARLPTRTALAGCVSSCSSESSSPQLLCPLATNHRQAASFVHVSSTGRHHRGRSGGNGYLQLPTVRLPLVNGQRDNEGVLPILGRTALQAFDHSYNLQGGFGSISRIQPVAYGRLMLQKQNSSKPPEPSPGGRKCSWSTMWLLPPAKGI